MNERNMKFFRSHLLLSFLEANWQTVSLFWFLCEYLCCSAMPSLFQSYCKVTQDRSLMLGREHLINSLLFLSNNKARNLIYLNFETFSPYFLFFKQLLFLNRNVYTLVQYECAKFDTIYCKCYWNKNRLESSSMFYFQHKRYIQQNVKIFWNQ